MRFYRVDPLHRVGPFSIGCAMVNRKSALVSVLLGVALLGLLFAVGETYSRGFELALGSLDYPDPSVLSFMACYSLFGTASALLLALGSAQLLYNTVVLASIRRLLVESSDRWWLFGGMLIAVLVPLTARIVIFRAMPITDDESAYQFSAELLASGRIAVAAHADKLFFDRNFMFNDGKVYSQYPLGWPALMIPFVWLKIPGYANVVYSTLAVAPLYFLLRDLTGRACARLGLVLYLASPFLSLMAATQMAHTSCAAALAWIAYLFNKSRTTSVPWILGPMALAFVLAFFIRPLSAIGFGAPLLLLTLHRLLRLPHSQIRLRLFSFTLPLVAGAALFLIVNKLQTGSTFKLPYQTVAEYYQLNNFRFSTAGLEPNAGFPINIESFSRAIGTTGGALLRLNLDAFGWPSSFALAAVSLGDRRSLPYLLSLGSFLGCYSLSNHIGVDTIGPSHFHETVVLLVILSVLGINRVLKLLVQTSSPTWLCFVPYALVSSCIILSTIVYAPIRVTAIAKITGDIGHVLQFPARERLGNSVMFAPWPLVHPCRGRPRPWVFFRPNNDPDLTRSILWVNDVSPSENARFLANHFPDRKGYRLFWDTECNVQAEMIRAWPKDSP